MLRYKTETRPGLVTLYDIRPGNGAGPFLQPRSPHEAPSHTTAQCYAVPSTDMCYATVAGFYVMGFQHFYYTILSSGGMITVSFICDDLMQYEASEVCSEKCAKKPNL